MDIEEEIADEISGIQVGSGYYSTTIGIDAAQEAAAALMPLFRRAQAEALREAAGEIEATFADYDRRRPLHPKAEVATDYVNDSQWAELIVRNRADRIEQNSGGSET
jgi:hypothetical protein